MNDTPMRSQQVMLNKMQSMRLNAELGAGLGADIKPNRAGTPASVSFGSLMKGTLDTINAGQKAASAKVHAVETGQSTDMVGAMVASQKASLTFSALMQVRNKLVQAFDDVTKMPL